MNLHLRGALANVENTLSKSPLLLQNKRERSHVRHGEKAGLLLSSPCLLGLVAAKTSPPVPKPENKSNFFFQYVSSSPEFGSCYLAISPLNYIAGS